MQTPPKNQRTNYCAAQHNTQRVSGVYMDFYANYASPYVCEP